jgi:hypothetical protein
MVLTFTSGARPSTVAGSFARMRTRPRLKSTTTSMSGQASSPPCSPNARQATPVSASPTLAAGFVLGSRPMVSAGPDPRGRLPGRQAKRFRMGPTVVLGQNLAEAAGPVRDSTAAGLAARDRKTSNGHRETARIVRAHRVHDASPARPTSCPPRACRMSALAAGTTIIRAIPERTTGPGLSLGPSSTCFIGP